MPSRRLPIRSPYIKLVTRHEDYDIKYLTSVKEKRNGTGLFDLPRELRDLIYAHVTVTDYRIDLGSFAPEPYERGHWHPRTSSINGGISYRGLTGTASLLLTSCQVYHEAGEQLYGRNRFCVGLAFAEAAWQYFFRRREHLVTSNDPMLRVDVLPFSPAWIPFVRDVCFIPCGANEYFGSDNFLLTMLVRLQDVQGAFIAGTASSHLLSVETSRQSSLDVDARAVAGWRVPQSKELPFSYKAGRHFVAGNTSDATFDSSIWNILQVCGKSDTLFVKPPGYSWPSNLFTCQATFAAERGSIYAGQGPIMTLLATPNLSAVAANTPATPAEVNRLQSEPDTSQE